jgi:Tir chaperone protein (CesT) family
MKLADFQQLCRDTCIALNYPDSDTLGSSNQITLDGVDIGLFFDDLEMNDRLVCYVDIGEVPTVDREEILARMLAINLLTGTKVSGVYGLDRQRDCIVFMQHFLYPEMLTGPELAEILSSYAKHAKEAKKTLMNSSREEPLATLLAGSMRADSVALA